MRRDRFTTAVVVALTVLGSVLLIFVVTRLVGHGSTAPGQPAATRVVVVTGAPPAPPAPSIPTKRSAKPQRVARPTAKTVRVDELRFTRNDRSHVRAGWVAGFYPIYEAASKKFGVNWLLIASIHKQETAFSTSATTYHGLNFANCCAGPMQFNVTNGPVSTWDRYGRAYELAPASRPRAYNHATAQHPSVYDDYDAIMAAAALLRTQGAGQALDANAWRAAYDYYGHDLTGVDYASQVLARAIGWGRRGFCINCEIDGDMLAAVDGAWGAPVRNLLAPAKPKDPKALAARHK